MKEIELSGGIVQADLAGNYTARSCEDLVGSGQNHWDGWLCSGGERGIYIDFDGDVFRGTCQVGGSLGNVFAGRLETDGSWIRCNKKACACGADMRLPKVRHEWQRHERPRLLQEQARTRPDFIWATDFLDRNTPQLQVIWNIGRRCNFDCSYCSPRVHSKREPYKSREELLGCADLIEQNFCRGQRAHFFFSGGEATFYPGFADLVRHLYQQGHELTVVSNGSHRADYYRKLIHRAHIALSAHFEFMHAERFTANVAAILREIYRHQLRAETKIRHRLNIKVMVPPGGVPRARAFAADLLALPGFTRYAELWFQPLYQKEDWDTLYDYSVEEMQFFRDHGLQEQVQRLRPPLWRRLWRGGRGRRNPSGFTGKKNPRSGPGVVSVE